MRDDDACDGWDADPPPTSWLELRTPADWVMYLMAIGGAVLALLLLYEC